MHRLTKLKVRNICFFYHCSFTNRVYFAKRKKIKVGRRERQRKRDKNKFRKKLNRKFHIKSSQQQQRLKLKKKTKASLLLIWQSKIKYQRINIDLLNWVVKDEKKNGFN